MKLVLAIAMTFAFTLFVSAQSIDGVSGALIKKLGNGDQRLQTVAFSPDGKLLAAGFGFFDNGGVTIWNTSDYSVAATLLVGESRQAGINRVAFSPSGDQFAAASDHGKVMLWAVNSWRSYKTILSYHKEINDLSFSPDGRNLAIATEDAAFLVNIKTTSATPMTSRTEAEQAVVGITFSPDGKLVVICGAGWVRVWDVGLRKVVKQWKTESFGFFGKLSPDGERVVEGGGAVYGGKLVTIWNLADGGKQAEITGYRNGLFAGTISNSGRLFAIAGGTYGGVGSLSLRNVTDGQEIAFVTGGDMPIQGVAFSPDDQILAAASESGFVLLYAVDQLRGPQITRQERTLCGEVVVEEGKTFVVPLAQGPGGGNAYEYAWKSEVVDPENVNAPSGMAVLIDQWDTVSRSQDTRIRIHRFQPLLKPDARRSADSEYILFGDIQNPGWGDGYVGKIYHDGTFVVARNLGECVAYGTLAQFNTDFVTVKKRMIDEGLLAVSRDPLSLGSAHFRVVFLGIATGGTLHLRSDADSIQRMLDDGSSPKRDAFRRVYAKEKEFIDQLVNAGIAGK